MPDPIRLARTIQQAAMAFRTTPGRHGRLVLLVEAEEVFVTGDLHGNLQNFRRVLEKAALSKHPAHHLVLQELIHGPTRYANGTDCSHQLLDLLAALKCQFPSSVHFLLGNHELAQWKSQSIAKANEEQNELFRAGVDTAYGHHAAAIYGAYLQLFSALPLAVRTQNRVFLSHSLPSAGRLAQFDPAILKQEAPEDECFRPGGKIHSLVWGRDVRPGTSAEFLQRVDADFLISGHVPCPQGFEFASQSHLILDSMGTPAGYCLFPTKSPLSFEKMTACVGIL